MGYAHIAVFSNISFWMYYLSLLLMLYKKLFQHTSITWRWQRQAHTVQYCGHNIINFGGGSMNSFFKRATISIEHSGFLVDAAASGWVMCHHGVVPQMLIA